MTPKRYSGVLLAAVVLVSILIAGLPTVGRAQETLPEIGLQVVIESVTFYDHWHDSAAVRIRILEQFHAECSTRFSFVNWSTESTPADSTQADSVQSDSVQADSVQVDSVQVDSTPLDFQLLVKVVGQSYDVGEEITMEFYAFVNGAKKPVPTKELELLYGKFDTPPSNDPEAFGDTVIAYLHGMLNRESFRQNLIGEFLSKVALGQQLNVDSSLNLIVLLLPWDDMRLEAGSKFNVEFASSGVFTQSPPGKMHLRSVYPDGENKHIVCEVCYLFHGNLRVNDCGEAWVEELVSVFKPSACRDLQVYIEHYVQNTNPPMINGRPGP